MIEKPLVAHVYSLDESLIESLPVACFVIKPDGLIKRVNKQGIELLKKHKSQLINKVFGQLILKQDEATFKLCRLNVIENKSHQSCEVRLFRADGDIIYTRLNLSIPPDVENDEMIMVVTDITYHKKIEDTQAFLLGNSWCDEGIDFFQAVAQYLGETLDVDFVWIDKLHNNEQAETVAMYHDGLFENNIRYFFKDTPCGKAMGHLICGYSSGVKFLFPNDPIIQQMDAQGYVGLSLWGSNSKPIGLIAVTSRKAMSDTHVIKMALKQVSIRVAAELEHRKMKEELVAATNSEILAHVNKEETLQKLNRTFSALSNTSQAMLEATDEVKLMQQVCRIIVEDCGYAFIWIGLAFEDEVRSIIPMASAGFEESYLETINLSWADTMRGRGPTGTAIRTGKYQVCQNTLTDPNFLPWREEAIKRGFKSSVALPLVTDGKAFGAIAIYHHKADSFIDDELLLLTKLANDLAHGITTIRLRAERARALVELENAKEELEILVNRRTEELQVTSEKLQFEIRAGENKESLIMMAEEKYRTIAENTYNCESWLGPDGKFLFISPSYSRITGYPIENFMDDPTLFYKMAHPNDIDKVKNHFTQALSPNDGICAIKFRIITRDGQELWMEHNCKPVFDSNGKWIGQRGSNRDITEHVLAMNKLLSNNGKLRTILHANRVKQRGKIDGKFFKY